MNEKTKKALLIGVPIVIGAYLILKQFAKKPTPTNTTKTPNAFSKHIVTTMLSNLNVRSTPSTSGNIIDSLPKGTEIFARPSQTSGWSEFSTDGTNVAGYVSSDYITKK
jgi:uncharacterized protein YgiM (DUF1202 family)